MRRASPVILLLALAACSPNARGPRTTWEGDRAQVLLEYSGRAESISVVGDFNGWQPGRDEMVQHSPDQWSLVLDLPSGRYLYLLRLEKEDGIHLIGDPGSLREIEDGLGRRLSVLDLDAAMGDIQEEP